MSLESYYLSVSGAVPAQDRVDVLRLDSGIVMIVADGGDGRSGGADAAELVVANVVNYFVHADYEISSPALVQLLADIDQALSTDENAGETTAVVAVVSEDGTVTGAFSGDSDAYLILPHDELHLTHGRRKPFLGSGAAWPEPFTGGLRDGTLVIATDGLWKYADFKRICEIVRSGDPLDAIAKRLVVSTRLPDELLHDDVGVALCRAAAGRD